MSSASLRNSLPLSSSPDQDQEVSPLPLRRTLSADMSSKKWLAQDGIISPMKMKKVASSIQLAKEEEEEIQKPEEFQSWSSILCQKAGEATPNLSPPYVHPTLVKKYASCLNDKSLQVCTESLGSETGSDPFSSHSSSECGDDAKEEGEEEEYKEEKIQQQETKTAVLDRTPTSLQITEGSLYLSEKEAKVESSDYYSTTVRKSPAERSFPPSITSLSNRDGASSLLRMQSRREDGRLVLQAVTVQSRNYFQAERENGRLLLKFINNFQGGDVEEEVDGDKESGERFEEVFRYDSEPEPEEKVEEEEEEEEEEMRPSLSLMMNKVMGTIDNWNPKWTTHKFNEATLPQSLPGLIPAPPAAAALNDYDYFWRPKPTIGSTANSEAQQYLPLKNKMVLSNSCPKAQNKEDHYCLVPSLRKKGCKEPIRSVLFWEPYCIATP